MKAILLHLFAAAALPSISSATEDSGIRFVPSAVIAPVRPAADEAILGAVRAAESQDNPLQVGARGERGAYQFRAGTWSQHTHAPFRAAHTDYAHEVAAMHLNWLRGQLVAAGFEASPYNVALCWNAGVAAVVRGRAPEAARNYAVRVARLSGLAR